MRFFIAMSAVFLLIAVTMLLAGAVSAFEKTRVVPPGESPLVGETREAGRATPVASASNALRALTDKLPDLVPNKPLSREERLVIAVNSYRAYFSLPPLQRNARLDQCARRRLAFATRNQSHCLGGCWPWDDARRYGFSDATEDLAWGYSTPESCVGTLSSGWGNQHGIGHDMQLRGYRKINGCWVEMHYTEIGVAISGTTYVAMFGRK